MKSKPINTEFEASYERMLAKQIKDSKGERKRRLSEGHGHAEKLFLQEAWWPAIGHFDFLNLRLEILRMAADF